MCGIIAVFCTKKPSTMKEILEAYLMLESRGPDQGKLLCYPDGIMGFQRLSINDSSTNGIQPMESKTGAKLMCNGEIYNHAKIEEELEIKCRSSSDCEFILGAYEKLGFVETVKKLDGDFAIIITDGDMVHLARDRIGVRPMFRGWTKDGDLAVASVAKALTGFCRDVEQIPPCMMSYNKTSKEFAVTDYNLSLSVVTDPTNALVSILIESVRKRLMSDRPIGCLLSGGLDSSLVASILCKFINPKDVRTYSIGMEGSTDLKYARKVATYLGTTHKEVVFTPEEGINAVPEVIHALESYDVTTIRASVGMYLLSKYIKENTTDRVIFSGEGSDELLCGYLYFHHAPTPRDSEDESFRLVKDLYMYDVLRADRTVSVHGLELRVPFLDRDFIDLAMSLSGRQKMPVNGYEKFVLRDAFNSDYLPADVLWRRKCGFSDGVSPHGKSWYEIIQDHVKTLECKEFDGYDETSFMSREAMWYKKIFDGYFPTYQPKMYMWMPKWVNANDPSGRAIYKGADKDQI